MNRPTGRARLLRTTVPALALLVLAGCGGAGGSDGTYGGDSAAGSPTSEPSAAATTEPSTAAGEGSAGTAVMVGDTSLGKVLVDADGMTLYMFDPDEQGESTCYDQCATAWPPLLTEGEPTAGDGADDSLLGTVERTDGTDQVTYDDWPLYYFAQDAAAGDVNGQAKSGVWWVLDAAGAPVRS